MQVCIFPSQVCLQNKEEYENYLRIAPECLDELYLYILFKDNITQCIKNMRDATTPKQKLTTKIFHVNSFVVLLSYVFLLISQFKVLVECFSSNQFDEIKYVLFFKIWIQQKCFKFCCLYYQIYLIRYSAVSRGKFGNTSTM